MTTSENGDTKSNRRDVGLGRNSVIVGAATALARVVALGREVLAARQFGVSAEMSAFTVAFQLPNLLRSLLADSALQGAFTPAFAAHVARGERREAAALAAAVAVYITAFVGATVAGLVLISPYLLPLLAPGLPDEVLVSNLARIMLPTVVMLAGAGLIAGVLNTYGEFTTTALMPVVWNGAIVVVLAASTGAAGADNQIYLYAIGVLTASVVQIAYPIPLLRRRIGPVSEIRAAFGEARSVLVRMVPVALVLGVINLALLVDSFFGSLEDERAPSAIDKAFRVFQLPQGLFSVAVATVLFPHLSKLAAIGDLAGLRDVATRGTRSVLVLLLPSCVLLAVLAAPITRLLFERGAFDAAATALTSEALVFWAVSLPAVGVSSVLWRVFFSLGKTRSTVALAGLSLVINGALAELLRGPMGIGGIVFATAVSSVVTATGQVLILAVVYRAIDARKLRSAVLRLGPPTATMAAACIVVLDWVERHSHAPDAVSIVLVSGAGVAAFVFVGVATGAWTLDELRSLYGKLKSDE